MGISSKKSRTALHWFNSALSLALVLIVFQSISFKLFLHKEHWLLLAVSWSFYGAVGYFVGKVTKELVSNSHYAIIAKIIIVIGVVVIYTFTFGVFLEFASWKYIVYNIVCPLITNIFVDEFSQLISK